MLFQKISRDGPAAGLIVFAHESPDSVADLHAAGFDCLTDGIGLQIAVFLGERLINLALNLLARMLGKGLHCIERDRLGPGRGADVGVDQAIAQPAFHGRHRGAEGLCDRLGRLTVDLHHPRKGLEFVDGVHRRLRDVLGERQGRGDVAVLRDKAAVHLGFRGEPLGGLVSDQVLQRGMTSATGQHCVLAVALLDQERLQETQNGNTGFQMSDVLGVIGFRGVAAHICGMGGKVADGDRSGFETCGHWMSFSVDEVGPARSRA